MVTAIDLSNQRVRQLNQKSSVKKIKVQRIESIDSDSDDPFGLMPKPQKRSGSLKPWQVAPAKEIFKLMKSSAEPQFEVVLLDKQASEEKDKERRWVEDNVHKRKSLITFHKTKQSDRRSASALKRAGNEIVAVD